ncbi:putative monooxygenase [Roridomyces roridus]|uniref:Monooxygenase n=1 Tax=Roridomyces roridus TaxID=1738132 RepID=A0AAD7CEB2_9AGAR|nr:putative monooxygenase [Roridomyces roridus]
MPSSPTTRIAIVGAGLGSLVLARILQLRKSANLSFVIYESDADASTHTGLDGLLNLKYESGQRALREAGLHPQFVKLCRPVRHHIRVLDKRGTLLHDAPGECYSREIDAGHLRGLLLESLEPNTVHWAHKATAVRRDLTSGKYTIVFESGEVAEGIDIIVGADGSSSHIRSLVWPGVQPVYSGITFIQSQVNLAEDPHFGLPIDEGVLFALEDGKGIMAQHDSKGRIMLYIALRVPEDWVTTSAIALAADPSERITLLLEEFEGWNKQLVGLVRAGERPTLRAIYTLPSDGRPRANTDNIVLLGDAAHLMSSFAGEGANLEMADATDLAKHLIAGKSLEKYERLIRHRATESAHESALNLELFFGQNAAEDVATLFKSQVLPRNVAGIVDSFSGGYVRSLFF